MLFHNMCFLWMFDILWGMCDGQLNVQVSAVINCNFLSFSLVFPFFQPEMKDDFFSLYHLWLQISCFFLSIFLCIFIRWSFSSAKVFNFFFCPRNFWNFTVTGIFVFLPSFHLLWTDLVYVIFISIYSKKHFPAIFSFLFVLLNIMEQHLSMLYNVV